MFEYETPTNDAQSIILEEAAGLSDGGMNPMPSNTASMSAIFLGESPLRWFLFIGMVLLWLWLWGRLVKYLGGHD